MTVDEFIAEWGRSGGNERANTQTFINDLCELIGVGRPRATQQDTTLNDYVFERHVVKTEIDGTTSNGWIDCYKRDSFILEAKQGSDRDREAVDTGEGDSLKDFFGQTAAERFKRGMARRGTGQWTAAMQKAAGQAEGYAKALPKEHGWPPFLKPHPVTGKPVPDETARVEVYRYINPRAAKWPKADFIIGNPPFIGGKDVRERLGDGYFKALFRTTKVPESADFVMHWWDKAAMKARKHQARRFGFVTTNSLPQTFSRRVVQSHLEAIDPLSLIFAIPDHPWVSEKGDAAVRIAMTVGVAGKRGGKPMRVTDESEAPDTIGFDEGTGTIHSDLTFGANVAAAGPLKSNLGLASRGVQLMGDGFIVTPDQAARLGLGTAPHVEKVIYDYCNGRDLMSRPRGVKVIDFYGLSEAEIRDRYPPIYQHVDHSVRPHREHNNRKSYRLNWWVFGEPRSDLRKALRGVTRYTATVETSKHRVFQFLPKATLADNMIVCVALDDAFHLGVLSSRVHVVWALAAGGRLGVGNDPRYNKTRCFDPFAFPDPIPSLIKQRIREAAEKLDVLRKQVLESHTDLTLTKLYNAVEELRSAEASNGVLSDKDRDIVMRGCVSLIRQYHDEIDSAVAEAYGWCDLLVQEKGGLSTGSGRTVFVDGAEEVILERLVALNRARAAEEARGTVRWLRPEYQAPTYVAPAEQAALALPEEEEKAAEVIEWPAKLPEQVVAVAGIVEQAGRPVAANDVAKAFKGKRAVSVTPVLDALAGMGRLRKLEDGRFAA